MSAIKALLFPPCGEGVKYDDASWHSGGDFPEGAPMENGATHIAVFVLWCWLNGLAGASLDDFPEARTWMQTRSLSPTEIFLRVCGGKFWDQDLSDLGNRFAKTYYQDGKSAKLGRYIDDYNDEFGLDFSSVYHVAADWTTYDRMAPVIARRFMKFRNANV
jgi:hypothetical protein